MPIRPDLRKFYRGPQWETMRKRILERAGNKCEQCRVPNHAEVERGPNGIWRLIAAAPGTAWRNSNGNKTTFEPLLEIRRKVRIVLTVAHLNHVAGDDRPENLQALCQWCHLHYDKEHHHETRSDRKDAARPLLNMASTLKPSAKPTPARKVDQAGKAEQFRNCGIVQAEGPKGVEVSLIRPGRGGSCTTAASNSTILREAAPPR